MVRQDTKPLVRQEELNKGFGCESELRIWKTEFCRKIYFEKVKHEISIYEIDKLHHVVYWQLKCYGINASVQMYSV